MNQFQEAAHAAYARLRELPKAALIASGVVAVSIAATVIVLADSEEGGADTPEMAIGSLLSELASGNYPAAADLLHSRVIDRQSLPELARLAAGFLHDKAKLCGGLADVSYRAVPNARKEISIGAKAAFKNKTKACEAEDFTAKVVQLDGRWYVDFD